MTHLQRSIFSDVKSKPRSQSSGSFIASTRHKLPGQRKIKYHKRHNTEKTETTRTASSSSGEASSISSSSQSDDTTSSTVISPSSLIIYKKCRIKKRASSDTSDSKSVSSENSSEKSGTVDDGSISSSVAKNTIEKSTLEITLTHDVEYEVRKVDPKEGEKEQRVQILRYRLQDVVKKLVTRRRRRSR